MHFGPSEAVRAAFYDAVRATGFKGPWEDASMSDRTNYYARRRVEQEVAYRGLSETQHYREYAKRCVTPYLSMSLYHCTTRRDTDTRPDTRHQTRHRH